MASLFYASDAGSMRRTWVPLTAWGTLIAVFGIFVAGMPDLTAGILVGAVGAVTALAGLVWVSWSVSLRRATGGWWAVSFVPGVLLLVFGAFALLRPLSVGDFLFQAAGALGIVWGLVDMASSWRLRAYFGAWWLRLIRGLLIAAVGGFVLFVPEAGRAAAGLIVGLWLVVIGLTTVAIGLAARRLPAQGAALITTGLEPPQRPLPPV